MADDEDRDAAISGDLLRQLTEEAQLLEVRDEVEDIALDLHRTPFSATARQRALSFLDSTRYRTAAESFSTVLPGEAEAS